MVGVGLGRDCFRVVNIVWGESFFSEVLLVGG